MAGEMIPYLCYKAMGGHLLVTSVDSGVVGDDKKVQRSCIVTIRKLRSSHLMSGLSDLVSHRPLQTNKNNDKGGVHNLRSVSAQDKRLTQMRRRLTHMASTNAKKTFSINLTVAGWSLPLKWVTKQSASFNRVLKRFSSW
jgi:hypothetical protein